MAKPIREIKRVDPTPEESQAQALNEILRAVADHKDVILDSLSILRHLHDMGVIEAVKGLLDQRHEVGVIAMQQLNQPKMHHTLKNAMSVIQVMGQIQPEHLGKLLNGLSHGFEAVRDVTGKEKAPSLWDLAKSVRDPAVRTSMATMVGILQGMGDSIHDDSSQIH